MKIRLYSDLHLEFYSDVLSVKIPPLPDDKETILILAGDISVGSAFIENDGVSWIEHVASQFKEVVIVLGNHDYWITNGAPLFIESGAAVCNRMLAERCLLNVNVLDCEYLVRDDIVIIGATLWTSLKNNDPLIVWDCPKIMVQDCRSPFSISETKFSTDRWMELHKKHLTFIEDACKKFSDKTVVVVTHHAPLVTFEHCPYNGQNSNFYFGSDLQSTMFDNPNLKYWFFGHTHFSTETKIGNCLVKANCVGYPNERLKITDGFVEVM